MLRSTFIAIAFGASLWAFASLDALGEPLARAALAVALGILVTALAYGHATFLAVGMGALSPLVFALLEKYSLGVAAAALCLCWTAPRLVLAESSRRLLLLAGLSVVAAAVSGFVFAAYVDAPWAAQAASCLFAGSCLSLTGLVPVDTGVSFALQTAAGAIEGPSRETLQRAARVHRQSGGRGSKGKPWRSLLRLADERAALQRRAGAETQAACKELDDRIAALAEELAPPERAPAPVGSTETPEVAIAAPGVAQPEVSFGTDAQSPVDIAAE